MGATMDRRKYGNTDEELSIIGFGGIVVKDTEPEEAARLVSRAVDAGVNYFDVAPSYGNAESCLGPALEPYRNGVFLACKTGKRDRPGAQEELENSLKLLRTDHVDLYQLHGMTSQEDFDQATGPGGALEFFIEAKEKGMIRHIGFSAHSSEIALALMDQFEFASVLFPVNWVNYFEADFGPAVVAKAQEKGMGRLALKAMAKSKLQQGTERRYSRCWYEPIDEPELASLALRFTLSQPITAAIPPGEPALFEMAVDLAESFQPITDEEVSMLKAEAGKNTPLFELSAA
jgi:aryl-alcohol dehydrogenase-like predicted oxidoreductase